MNKRKESKRVRKLQKELMEYLQNECLIPNLPEPNKGMAEKRRLKSLVNLHIRLLLSSNHCHIHKIFPCLIGNNGNVNLLEGYQVNQGCITKPVYDEIGNQVVGYGSLQELTGTPFPLTKLYASMHGTTDDQATIHLLDHLRISTSPLSKIKDDEHWLESSHIPESSLCHECYQFHGANGGILFSVVGMNIDGERVLTPQTPWIRTGMTYPIFHHLMPQDQDWPMFNANAFVDKNIVIIANDLAMAAMNADNCIIKHSWLTWGGLYGGAEYFPGYAYSTLSGKLPVFLMKGLSPYEDILDAIAFLKEIRKVDVRDIVFVNMNISYTNYGQVFVSPEILTPKELVVRAREMDIYVEDNLVPVEINTISASDTSIGSEPEYLINDTIETNTITSVSGPGGTGKSFFIISIGLGVVQCVPVCDGWVPFKPRKELYIEQELGLKKTKERINLLSDLYPENKNLRDNMFISSGSFNFNDEKDQKKLIKRLDELKYEGTNEEDVGLIMFDALANLFKGAETPKTFQEVTYPFMKRLMDKYDCSIIFAHHTDKEAKGMRGTSIIRDRVDTSIILKKEEGCINHTMHVSFDKARNLSPQMSKPFSVELDLIQNKWRVTRSNQVGQSLSWKVLSDDQRYDMIFHFKGIGYTDTQIATTLGVSRKTITNFKNKHNILDKDIKE